MHKYVHVNGALRILQDRRPKIWSFLITHLSVDEVIKFLDAPDELDHSATNGSHSYKLELVDGQLHPHIKTQANQDTVLAKLKADFIEIQELIREGELRFAAMRLCHSIHWRIDARTPPHIQWKWSDRAHAAIENDIDLRFDRAYAAITEWPEEPIHDLYREVREDLFQAYGEYHGLMETYEAGQHADDARLFAVVLGVAQQLNRYLAHVEHQLTKSGVL